MKTGSTEYSLAFAVSNNQDTSVVVSHGSNSAPTGTNVTYVLNEDSTKSHLNVPTSTSSLTTSDKLHYNNVTYSIASAYTSGENHIVVTNQSAGSAVPGNVNYDINLDNTKSKLFTSHNASLTNTQTLTHNNVTYNIGAYNHTTDNHIVVTNSSAGTVIPWSSGNEYIIYKVSTHSHLNTNYGSSLTTSDKLTISGVTYNIASAYSSGDGKIVVAHGTNATPSGTNQVYQVNLDTTKSKITPQAGNQSGSLSVGTKLRHPDTNIDYTVASAYNGSGDVVITNASNNVVVPANKDYKIDVVTNKSHLNTTYGSSLTTSDKLKIGNVTYDVASAYSSGDGKVIVSHGTNPAPSGTNQVYEINPVSGSSYSVNSLSNKAFILSLGTALSGSVNLGSHATAGGIEYCVERGASSGAPDLVVVKSAPNHADASANTYVIDLSGGTTQSIVVSSVTEVAAEIRQFMVTFSGNIANAVNNGDMVSYSPGGETYYDYYVSGNYTTSDNSIVLLPESCHTPAPSVGVLIKKGNGVDNIGTVQSVTEVVSYSVNLSAVPNPALNNGDILTLSSPSQSYEVLGITGTTLLVKSSGGTYSPRVGTYSTSSSNSGTLTATSTELANSGTFKAGSSVIYNEGNVTVTSTELKNNGSLTATGSELFSDGKINTNNSTLKNDGVFTVSTHKIYNLGEIVVTNAEYYNEGSVSISSGEVYNEGSVQVTNFSFYNEGELKVTGLKSYNEGIVNITNVQALGDNRGEHKDAIFKNTNFKGAINANKAKWPVGIDIVQLLNDGIEKINSVSLKEQVIAGRENFKNVEFVGNDKQLDLSGIDFHGHSSSYDGALTKPTLEGALFDNCDLTNVVFGNADLSGVVLRNVNLDGADFSQSDISGIKLEMIMNVEKAKWPVGFDYDFAIASNEPLKNPSFIEILKGYPHSSTLDGQKGYADIKGRSEFGSSVLRTGFDFVDISRYFG